MSLIERAREAKIGKESPSIGPARRRWFLERLYGHSRDLLEEEGTRVGTNEFFSFRVNDPLNKPTIEVTISREIGHNSIRLEVEGIDERLTIEETGQVRNAQRQFQAYLVTLSSGLIREASLEDAKEYSEVIGGVRSQVVLS